jgi:hypothetical protein
MSLLCIVHKEKNQMSVWFVFPKSLTLEAQIVFLLQLHIAKAQSFVHLYMLLHSMVSKML